MTLRLQIIILVLLLLAGGFCVFCYFHPLVHPSGYRLMVDGVQESADFSDISGGQLEPNLFRQPFGSMIRSLLVKRPDLSAVCCRVNISGEVVCEARRKKPVAVVYADKLYGVAEGGEILPPEICGDMSALPLISGVRPESVREYTKPRTPRLDIALELCRKLGTEHKRLRNAVSEIDIASAEAPVIYFKRAAVRVIVGPSDFDRKLAYLDRVFERLGSLAAGELDLRFGRSVIARELPKRKA
jgi:hypothetical protein